MKKHTNMYSRSIKQWNPFVGCMFNCTYCKKSFQRQLKRWGKKNCNACYTFQPHIHHSRFDVSLPRTKGNEFIFVCSSGDISFCPNSTFWKIMEIICRYPSKTFLLQSKNPECFQGLFPKGYLPSNLILGTTLETDIDTLSSAVSLAPPASSRYEALAGLAHPRKMVSIEPIMKFNHKVLSTWIKRIKPEFVYIGYDTVGSSFPQPTIAKALRLVDDLRKSGIDVICKKLHGNLYNG